MGLSQGFAFSVLPLVAALAIPLITWACLAKGGRQAMARLGSASVGLAMGLWPTISAFAKHTEHASSVFGTRTLAEILSWRGLGALQEALGGVLGAYTCTFPDLYGRLALATWPEGLILALFALLLIAGLGTGMRSLARRIPSEQAASSGLLAAISAAPVLGMALFLINDRSHAGQFRYLLIVPWCLPFLWLQVHRRAGKRMRKVMGAAAAFLALFNLLTSLALGGRWMQPGFAGRDALTPDIGPALSALRQEGKTHCFAAFWTAYRITLESNREIICSQPFNERFYGWPIPYRDEVARDPSAAYVLTTPDSFDTILFESALDLAGVGRRRTPAGSYTVYDKFNQEEPFKEWPLARERIVAKTSHGPSRAGLLVDGRVDEKWNSGKGQEKGMWLELDLGQPLPVSRLVLRYHDYAHDQPGSLRLSCRNQGKWQVILGEAPAALDPLEFANHLPLFGEKLQTLRFAPTWADGLRLEIVSPRPDRLWTLAEIEVFGAEPRP